MDGWGGVAVLHHAAPGGGGGGAGAGGGGHVAVGLVVHHRHLRVLLGLPGDIMYSVNTAEVVTLNSTVYSLGKMRQPSWTMPDRERL